MKILYSFPTRQRPHQFIEAMQNIKAMSASENYYIAVKMDEDDHTLDVLQSILPSFADTMPDYGNQYGFYYANHKSKVEAVNSFISGQQFDVLICMSDDMRFIVHGFDDIIRQHMPADLDCLLHFPDGYANDRVCTMSIIGREYYKRDGYIYNPAYTSLWADNEETEKAKMRGKYKYIPDQLFQHMHYANGYVSKDALYRRNDTYHADKLIYEEREKRNFDIARLP